MAKSEEIHSRETRGVKAPRLTELKDRDCTKEELQAALVQLIEIVNFNQEQVCKLSDRVARKADREWQATI